MHTVQTNAGSQAILHCIDVPPVLLDGLTAICDKTDFAHAELVYSIIASTWIQYSRFTRWDGLVWDAVYRSYEGDEQDEDIYVDFCTDVQTFVDDNLRRFENHFNRVCHGDMDIVDVIPTEVEGAVLWGQQEETCRW